MRQAVRRKAGWGQEEWGRRKAGWRQEEGRQDSKQEEGGK